MEMNVKRDSEKLNFLDTDQCMYLILAITQRKTKWVYIALYPNLNPTFTSVSFKYLQHVSKEAHTPNVSPQGFAVAKDFLVRSSSRQKTKD